MFISNISKLLNVSRPTIYNVRKNIKRKNSGRKITYNEKKIKYQLARSINVLVKRKENVTARKILPFLTKSISLTILQRFLRKSNLFILRNTKKEII